VDAMEVLLNRVLAQGERDTLAAQSQEDRLASVATSVAVYLDPSRHWWRMLRLEAHLAARHRPLAASVLFEAFDESLRTYPAATGLVESGVIARLQPLLSHFTAVVLGLGLVDALLGPLQDVDWRPAIYPFGEVR